MRALIVVDVQNDFLPGGALGVKNGDEVIPVINQLLKKDFDVVVASKDWHPADHVSFAKSHNKQPGEVVNISGIQQILWPTHCVQDTFGAEFGSGLDTSKLDREFHKGTDKWIDSYSTFFDNLHQKSTGLENYLRKKNVRDIYLAGLTTEYCVKNSTLDALKLGFNVFVVEDGCRGVNLNPNDSKNALEEMKKAGAKIIQSKDV